jgi:ArsR family transcriptional regulator
MPSIRRSDPPLENAGPTRPAVRDMTRTRPRSSFVSTGTCVPDDRLRPEQPARRAAPRGVVPGRPAGAEVVRRRDPPPEGSRPTPVVPRRRRHGRAVRSRPTGSERIDALADPTPGLLAEPLRSGRIDGETTHAIVNSMDIELAARRLDALGNPTRLMIFRALVRAGRSGLPVRQLQAQVGVAAASTLSHHLQRLVAAGLVAQERQSTTLICRAEPAALRELGTFVFEGADAAAA